MTDPPISTPPSADTYLWYDDEDKGIRMYLGDCVEVMKGMEEGSVDAVVCDPPYGLSFMGKTWDQFEVSGGIGAGRNPKAGATGRAHSHGLANNRPVPYQEWCTAWAAEALRVGWKGWLGIVVGLAVIIAGVAALAKGPQRPA